MSLHVKNLKMHWYITRSPTRTAIFTPIQIPLRARPHVNDRPSLQVCIHTWNRNVDCCKFAVQSSTYDPKAEIWQWSNR